MSESFYIVASISVIIFSLAVAKASMGKGFALTPLFLFISTSVVFINSGFIVLYHHNSHEAWAFSALSATSLGLLSVSLGGFLASTVQKLPIEWPTISESKIKEQLQYGAAVRTSLVVFGIVGLYFFLVGYVPLFEGIKKLATEGFVSGLTNTLRVSRDVYVHSDSSTYIPFQGLLEAVRYFALPITAIWFLAFYRQGIATKRSAFFLIISISLTILTGQRWPLMYLFLTILIFLSWTEDRVASYAKVLGRVFITAIAFGVLLSALLGRTTDNDLSPVQMITFGFFDLLNRILLGNVSIPFLSYSHFPEKQDWLLGWSWAQNLLAYLPGPLPSYPVTFYQLISGDTKGYTAPPDFFTEAYINFGLIGVAVISFFWGILLSMAQRLILKRRESMLYLSIYSLLCTLIAFSAFSGVSFILGGIIVVALLLIILRISGYSRPVDESLALR